MRIRLRHQRLRRLLATSGRSQNAWALALGLDSGHLSKLVNGRRRYPGAATRAKLLEGLGVQFDELFEFETPQPERKPAPPNRRHSRERAMSPTSIGSDLRYALRMMRHHPGFASLAIIIIALGVGTNSAVFGLVNAVLLSPLPFPQSERLALVWSTDEARGGGGKVSFPDFLDWQGSNDSFEAMAAFQEDSFILGGDEGAERVVGEMVSPDYFPLLGAVPVHGRTTVVEEPEPVLVLNEAFAERRFGDAASALGELVQLNDASFRVIGIVPRTFRGFTDEAQLWVPMRAFDALNPELREYEILDNRGTRWHSVVGRLRAGVEVSEASAEMRSIADALSETYPRSNDQRSILVRPAHDEIVSDYRSSLLMLSASVGVLLLLACVNLANLFLLRVISRRDEVSVRLALGANRFRLVRQLLTETVVFSLTGGAFGLVIARLSARFFEAFVPDAFVAGSVSGFDGEVFAFALALSAITGIAFGLIPSLAISSPGEAASLGRGARSHPGRRRALACFVLAEMAIATLLLVGTGLVVKSFINMQRFDPGFTTDNVLTAHFHVPASVAEEAFLEQLALQAAAVPGVESAAIASHLYFGDGYMSGDATVEGFEPKTPADEIKAYQQFVTDDYFAAMGIPLIEGQGFVGLNDVAIVNESFARKMWPDESAVGKRVVRGSKGDDEPWLTIVGVVGDVVPGIRLDAADRLPQFYFPMRNGGLWSRTMVLRTHSDPAATAPVLRAELRELHRGMALFSVATMNELLARQRRSLRYVAQLMGGFAALALVLAAIGLYGVIGYAVGQLRREIGIRVAVGATRRDIVAMVMRPAAVLIVTGLAAGLLSAVGVTRFAASLLYGVDPLDGVTFAVVATGLTLVAFAATYLPARRAAHQDPVQALRQE